MIPTTSTTSGATHKTPAPITQAWAIKAPTGVLLVRSDSDTEDKAWLRCDPIVREMAKEANFRCVRVQITEVQE